MAIKGEEREHTGSYTKYVGVFSANIVAVNPTNAQLGKLLGTEIEKEIEYGSFNDDTGAKRMILSFWVQAMQEDNPVFNIRFLLEDTAVQSKGGKPQFINSVGNASYSDNEESLPPFITNNGKIIRQAMKGEENLYKFLQSWLSNLDYTNPDTEVYLDFKSLITGKLSELKGYVAQFSEQTVGAMATIRTSTDGKDYQSVYPYEFLPAYAVNYFYGKSKAYKIINRFVERVSNDEYGCKDYYELGPLKEYDPTKNVLNSSATVISTAKSTPATEVKTKTVKKAAVVENPPESEDSEEEEVSDDDLPF